MRVDGKKELTDAVRKSSVAKYFRVEPGVLDRHPTNCEVTSDSVIECYAVYHGLSLD